MIYGILITITQVISIYVIWNLLRKTEMYEDTIVRFNEGAINILTKMRIIDERQMFEKDDEVGILFEDLSSTIGELRYILYGEETEEEPILDGGDGTGYY